MESTAAATWPPEAVHLEYFAADPLSLAGPQESFQVKLARSGGTYSIPAGTPIIEVLAEHGVHIETSCEQGVCGTCLTGVLDGIPDHRDVFLTDAEKKILRQDDALCFTREKVRCWYSICSAAGSASRNESALKKTR
ncbi:2Fe-2S iron-sulfur cluster-binding protein [Undibacterium arcticum]